jgi:UPF0755 protein
VSLEDIVAKLRAGEVLRERLTIVEGWTFREMRAELARNPDLKQDSVRLDTAALLKAIGAGETHPEGLFAPDTYVFDPGSSDLDVLRQAYRAQTARLQKAWTQRSADLPLRTPYEALILASIVEKETGRADERTRVAGVFINRLVKRMKLQSDPTIVYGIVGGKGTLGRGIMRSEIEQATPYNTYMIEGLPPSAIANPGRAALEAVANPSRTKDLYFVADGSGGHTFAESYDQHTKNVARWRQVEKSRATGDAQGPVDRVDPGLSDNRTDAGGQPMPTGAAAYTQEQLTGPAVPGQPPRAAGGRGQARTRGVDASEGTPRDPLLNKSFDLNSAKTVPALRQP